MIRNSDRVQDNSAANALQEIFLEPLEPETMDRCINLVGKIGKGGGKGRGLSMLKRYIMDSRTNFQDGASGNGGDIDVGSGLWKYSLANKYHFLYAL